MKAGDRRPGLPPINHNDPINNLDDSTVLPVSSDFGDRTARPAGVLIRHDL